MTAYRTSMCLPPSLVSDPIPFHSCMHAPQAGTLLQSPQAGSCQPQPLYYWLAGGDGDEGPTVEHHCIVHKLFQRERSRYGMRNLRAQAAADPAAAADVPQQGSGSLGAAGSKRPAAGSKRSAAGSKRPAATTTAGKMRKKKKSGSRTDGAADPDWLPRGGGGAAGDALQEDEEEAPAGAAASGEREVACFDLSTLSTLSTLTCPAFQVVVAPHHQ